jgi:putative transposase
VKQIFRFIENQTTSFAVSALCQVLKVSKSGFYGYLKTAKQERAEPLAKAVKEVFWRHRRRYGSRRIHAEVVAEGNIIGRHKVRRLMKDDQLQALTGKSFVPQTTNSRHLLRMSTNLLRDHQLPPQKPNAVIVGDITYLPLPDGGFVYLATWEDLFSRMIVGWQIEETLEEKVVSEAMKKVILRREPPEGLIVHSDRGGHYASNELRRILQSRGYRQSMSRAGETYDNAYAESLFSRYKTELLEGGAFADVEEARLESFDYIENYYNRVRRHSALGYLSPVEYEQKYYAKQQKALTKKSKERIKVK